ncbi:hypothetical protein EVG20_g2963, partial [Dentipellis fragilis]
FVGCAGDASFDDIKRPLKERFARAPFVKYTRGEDSGLVGFDKALGEDDIAFVKEQVPKLNGKDVTWSLPEEEEERAFEVEPAAGVVVAAVAAEAVVEAVAVVAGAVVVEDGAVDGDGGRGPRRDAGESAGAAPSGGDAEQMGEKRKRAVEPDGGHDVGVRGAAVPSIASVAKKAKTDGES